MSWRCFLILNISALQLYIWPQMCVKETLYGAAKCSSNASHIQKGIGLQQERKMRSEIRQRKAAGVHAPCLRGSQAGSTRVAQAVLKREAQPTLVLLPEAAHYAHPGVLHGAALSSEELRPRDVPSWCPPSCSAANKPSALTVGEASASKRLLFSYSPSCFPRGSSR